MYTRSRASRVARRGLGCIELDQFGKGARLDVFHIMQAREIKRIKKNWDKCFENVFAIL